MILIILLLLFSNFLLAQQEDSVKTYNLEQVTIQSSRQLETKRVIDIEAKDIERADASAVSELAKYIPSTKVQTNSRGETLFYIRGAGERQVILFFDGVPLNTPWDNRIDLSLIPAEAIGEINVVKGIPSVTYGVNAISGVVNIKSKRFTNQGFGKLVLQRGENQSQYYSGIYLNGNDNFSYLISSSYKSSNGFSLPSSFTEPYQPSSEIRLNSFSNSFDLFGKVKYKVNEKTDLGLSLAYSNSDKGVPPEIDVKSPRFWKYPVWDKLSLSLNGEYQFPALMNSKLSFHFSGTYLKTQIDQYKTSLFSIVDDIEKSEDMTVYGGFNYSGLISSNSIIKLSLNGYTTEHNEEIKSKGFVENQFAQNVFSMGGEYEYFLSKFIVIAGLSYDFSEFTKTGDKPPVKDLHDYSFNTGLVYSLDNNNSVYVSFGRKTRFPTLRESLSGALGRFVPNPSLSAESSIAGELGFTNNFDKGKTDISLFVNFLNDGIVRKSLEGGKFQRVNEDVIRIFGIETSSNISLTTDLSFLFNITYTNSFAKNNNGEFKDTLEYKPSIISSLNVLYSVTENLESFLEMQYTGEEFGLQEGNQFFQRLPDHFIMSFRLSYEFELFSKKIEIFGRVNNIFDKLYYSQWGLPEAGRRFLGGITAQF